ncbi:ribonucleases P/MRP protein subunit POP1-domain-containing protein [Xylariaceae sp. FL0016]|nr:ribonucleases P/MRP protein subunit POP1-domain-containing protein [Xylariaceae sp. FL0016]
MPPKESWHRPKPVAHINKGSVPEKTGQTTKRKLPPNPDSRSGKPGKDLEPDAKAAKRAKMRDTRSIASQRSHDALENGELNVQSFVNSMAFEINALDESMQRTRTSKSSRAFQRVPFTMRRRAAAHDMKRVPKRLRRRAKREMMEDNTPTVNAKTRKPKSSRAWLRAETARKLGILAERKRKMKLRKRLAGGKDALKQTAVRPKIKRNELNEPLITAPKFRKRQKKKAWLPSHLWHTKRARMTAPSQPLWGFSIPLTPTQKIYRPTHRIQWEKGAMAWDVSYMSTIGLFGSESSIRNVLQSVGLALEALWNDKGLLWRNGVLHWSGQLGKKYQSSHFHTIGPAVVIWNPQETSETPDLAQNSRQVLIRVHPSAFLETFNELLRVLRMQKPRPYIQDLRYEIGSIDITGPDSTEALIGVLKPYFTKAELKEPHAHKFESLLGLRDPASLPPGSLLSYSIMDPRLHHPPKRMVNQSTQACLMEAIANFRNESETKPHRIFDRDERFKATRLPSQQSLNRRRGKGTPGSSLEATKVDPPIPVLIMASRAPPGSQAPGKWTVLLPWKCVLPVWYSLMHYPLSTGGNPAFGGLDEIRHMQFESGQPWFPGDMPGTNAGSSWELEERQRRKLVWDRKPRGKRVNWDSLDLGAGRRGEVGFGWHCDYELLSGPGSSVEDNPLAAMRHLSKTALKPFIAHGDMEASGTTLVIVHIMIMGRGVPATCARIYRLPEAKMPVVSSHAEVPATDPPLAEGQLPVNLREQWLSRRPTKGKPQNKSSPSISMDAEARRQWLAQQLLGSTQSHPSVTATSDSINGHPLCPSEEDLIGFVTTGSFNLHNGRGEGIATLSGSRAIEEMKRCKDEKDSTSRLCVVRNSGQNIGWLARWELI